ncbi:SspB family protein [Nitrobacter hamburgensis]|nr:ClpXP protease specificity-enhancing factor SspB [Nitrobacter hamburgensis]
MSTDHIRYDLLARDALRGVLRRVLTDAAEQGLPGEHHFFITFMSKADGVKISPRLLAQHPEEMTIILQHQFWDLTVSEERFEVGLSFGGIPERLVVPFNSIKSFYDPSVQFGLQFEPAETETAAADMPPGAPSPAVPSPAVLAVPDTPSPPAAAETEDKPKPSEGAEVVRLDRFRKK